MKNDIFKKIDLNKKFSIDKFKNNNQSKIVDKVDTTVPTNTILKTDIDKIPQDIYKMLGISNSDKSTKTYTPTLEDRVNALELAISDIALSQMEVHK